MRVRTARSPGGADIRRPHSALLLLPVAVLGLAVAVTGARRPPSLPAAPTDAVSTVANLADHLAAHPAPWVGQVVRVRAVAVVMPVWVLHGRDPARRLVSLLVDPEGRHSLPLVLGPEDWLLAALRRLPLVGALIPPLQARVWGEPEVYRIMVEAVHGTGSVSYEAVLLDAGNQDS